MIRIRTNQITNYANLEVGYDILEKNINNNYHRVRFYLILHLSQWVSWSRGTARVWDNVVNLKTKYSSGTHTLVTQDVNLFHNENGDFTGLVTANLNTTFISGDCSGFFTLPNIPRQANLIEASNFNDEENPTIKYQNLLGEKAENLQACISINGDNDDIKYRDISKTENNYTFNLTDDEKNILRNATTTNSRTITFFVRTIISGTHYYSTLNRTFSIVNANPVFTNFKYKDINTKTTSITQNNQVFIKGYSDLEVTIDEKMIPIKGATPQNYNLTFDDKVYVLNYSDNIIKTNFKNIISIGKQRLVVKAFDSRGNYTEVYRAINVYNYEKPKIYVDITRKNNFENETTLKISGKYDELKINNVSKNSLLSNGLKYRYRETEGVWSYWIDVIFTKSQGEYNANNIILNLDREKSFEFEIEAKDNLDKNIVNVSVDVGIPAFFVSSNKKSIGINCLPPPEAKDGEIWYKTNKLKKVLDYEIKNNVIHFENDYYTKGLQFYTNEPNLIGYYNEHDVLSMVLELNNIEFVANQPKTFPLNLGNLQILDFKVYLYLNANNRWYVNYDGINNSNITINDTGIEFRPTQSFVFDKMRIILKYFKEG